MTELQKSRIVHDFIIEQFGVDYWEDYQRDIFLSINKKEVIVKSRQVGLSYAFSADALARALLFGEKFLITSYNRDEASEKIGFIRNDFLPHVRISIPRVVNDAQHNISFENGGEIKSVPAHSVRGRSKNVYADEFEYYKNSLDIYRAILPSVVREDDTSRVLRIWSTPLTKTGILYRIISNERSSYVVRYVYWWECSALCRDVRRAREEAPFMETYDRVYKFGTKNLIEQFEDPSLSLEEFRTEFECDFSGADEDVFIPFDVLKDVLYEYPYRHYTSSNFSFIYKEGKVKIGMDVGRRNNASEIVIFNMDNRLLCNITLRGVPFSVQREVCEKLLSELDVDRFVIDGMGIGMNIAEDLRKRYGSVVQVVEFTNKKKDELASMLKKLIETKQIELPYDRRLISHILSVRRKVEEGSVTPKYYVVSSGDDIKANADKFWAIAMAVSSRNVEKAYAVAENKEIGYKRLDNIRRRLLLGLTSR